MRARSATLLTTLAVVLVTACGGGGDGGDENARESPNERRTTTTTNQWVVEVTDSFNTTAGDPFDACEAARAALAAAESNDFDATTEAIRRLVEVIDVFPNRYQNALVEGSPYADIHYRRMVELCDREQPAPTTTTTTTPPPPPPPAAVYELTGTGSVFVTLSNESGGTEQFTTALPYSREMTTAPDFLYISAQLEGAGEVTCAIRRGFSTVQTATSSGQYVIATCSG